MRTICTKVLALALVCPGLHGQEAKPSDPSAAKAAASKSFSKDQLEQIAAPIALYPDALLTQTMMAATYPLEVVEASRWVKANPSLKADKLDAALQKQPWDPSVKSLCALPDVLGRLDKNLDWTKDLGDAFLGQQAELMDAVQTLRTKAHEAGNLKSGKEQKVTTQEDKIIVIESADPKVVYVPTYYPTAVYGPWGYPSYFYPPLFLPPPAAGLIFGFTVGVFVGAGMWGGCVWHHGHSQVNINVNHYNNFVNKTEISSRRQQVRAKAGAGGSWHHDPSHRQGVRYSNSKVAKQYGSRGNSHVSRNQARGYSDRYSQRRGTGTGARPKPAARPTPSRRPTSSARPTPSRSGTRSGSLSGVRSPGLDRAARSRGSSSRGSFGSRSGGFHGGGRRGGFGRRR